MKIKLQKLCKPLFLITIFIMPLYLVKVKFFGIPTNLFEIVAIISIGLFLLTNKLFSLLSELKKMPLYLLLGITLLFLGITISSISNVNLLKELGIIKSWFLLPIIFSYLLYLQIKTRKDLEGVLLALFYSSLFVAFLSLIYKSLGIETFDGRLTAFYLSPNHLAMYLVPGFIASIYFTVKYFQNSKVSRFFLQILSLSIISLAIYFTYSYGTWLALFFTIIITTIFYTKKKHALLLLFLGSIFILTVFSFQINSSKFQSLLHVSERSSLASRLTIWQVSFDLIKENPIKGIGPGNFQEKYLEKQIFYPPFLEWAVPQPHNILLAFYLQTGFFGFIGIIIILIVIFYEIYCLKNKTNVIVITFVSAFLIYTLLHGIIDTPYWKNDLSFIFWNVIMLLFASKKLEH